MNKCGYRVYIHVQKYKHETGGLGKPFLSCRRHLNPLFADRGINASVHAHECMRDVYVGATTLATHLQHVSNMLATR